MISRESPRPSLFIGSSSENLEVALAAQEILDRYAEVTVWDQGIFDLTKYTLEALLDALGDFNFGLFIFAPDDEATMRGHRRETIRDNVVFELGLFIGRLGRERTFILSPRSMNIMHLPSDILGVTLAKYDPNRRDHNLAAAVAPACHRIGKSLAAIFEPHVDIENTLFISRRAFTEILVDRLKDETVKTVRMLTYTAEVDAHLINRYHVVGDKTFEVSKRSILEDLAEQQECNLKRLAAGSKVKPWHKRRKSFEASEILEREVPQGSTLKQHFYLGPPLKRAYLFDNDEALVAYYEVLSDPLVQGGSVYKGMTDAPAIRIKADNPLGCFLIDQLKTEFAALSRSGRSWEEEKEILDSRAQWSGGGNRPCVDLRAVFFDLDGILYDSMPLYARAWKEGFKVIDVEFPEEQTYLEEGRRGTDTIRRYLAKVGWSEVDEETVEKVHRKKRDVMQDLSPPPIQGGAYELIAAVAKSKLDIWIVTGSSRGIITDRITEDFDGLIREENIVCGDDVRSGKPFPDPYRLACRKAGVHPQEVVAIENSPLGVRSATTAGTFCIGVNTGILGDYLLESEGARVVFSSCSVLEENWPQVVSMLRE